MPDGSDGLGEGLELLEAFVGETSRFSWWISMGDSSPFTSGLSAMMVGRARGYGEGSGVWSMGSGDVYKWALDPRVETAHHRSLAT